MRFRDDSLVLALLASLAGLAGCGDLGEPTDGRFAGAGEDVRTRAQYSKQMCGADRYNGVQGVDVSKYQPNFDWQKWSNQGIEFGFARVSDGTQYIDATFPRHWKGMKNNGVIRGAYQFFRPNLNARDQANIVVNRVGKLGKGDLPCVLDIERTGGKSPSTIASKMKTWLQIVENGTGKKPIIYTSPSFFESNIHDSALTDYPLWIAHWGTSCPSIPNSWNDWTFWQYCNGDPQYCKNGAGFDRNVFNGSLDELKKFAGGSGSTGGPDWKAEFVQQSFPLASTAMEMAPGETKTGFIEMKNAGEKTWNSDTRLGTTEPRDRTSKFAHSSWINPTRPAGVSGTVKPGESHKFEFTFEAPSQPGTYREYFNLVQEGVTWFSESGGPKDDMLQVKIEVEREQSMQEPDTGTHRRDVGVSKSDVGIDAGTAGKIGPAPEGPDAGLRVGADAGGRGGQPLGSLVARSNGSKSGCSHGSRPRPPSLLHAVLLLLVIGGSRSRRE